MKDKARPTGKRRFVRVLRMLSAGAIIAPACTWWEYIFQFFSGVRSNAHPLLLSAPLSPPPPRPCRIVHFYCISFSRESHTAVILIARPRDSLSLFASYFVLWYFDGFSILARARAARRYHSKRYELRYPADFSSRTKDFLSSDSPASGSSKRSCISRMCIPSIPIRFQPRFFVKNGLRRARAFPLSGRLFKLIYAPLALKFPVWKWSALKVTVVFTSWAWSSRSHTPLYTHTLDATTRDRCRRVDSRSTKGNYV